VYLRVDIVLCSEERSIENDFQQKYSANLVASFVPAAIFHLTVKQATQEGN